jgi:hypothetical protein
MTAHIGPDPAYLRRLARKSYREIIAGRMSSARAVQMVAYLEREGEHEAASWVRLAMADHRRTLRSRGLVHTAMRWLGAR